MRLPKKKTQKRVGDVKFCEKLFQGLEQPLSKFTFVSLFAARPGIQILNLIFTHSGREPSTKRCKSDRKVLGREWMSTATAAN